MAKIKSDANSPSTVTRMLEEKLKYCFFDTDHIKTHLALINGVREELKLDLPPSICKLGNLLKKELRSLLNQLDGF